MTYADRASPGATALMVIPCAACWEHRNGPSRSVAMTRRQVSRSRSRTRSECRVPAMLTSTPRPPSCGEPVDDGTGVGRRRVERLDEAPLAAPGDLFGGGAGALLVAAEGQADVEPLARSRVAVARPMPESLPVTIASRGRWLVMPVA